MRPDAERDWAAIGREIERRAGIRVLRNEPLAGHTTMRVGGPADLFATAHNLFELRALVRFARTRAIPHVVLGRGSDLVVSDAGIRGLVILCRAEGHRIDGERLIAEAGLPMARAATVTQQAGLSGLEFGLAIPGTVGGAVWANAGAHESEVKALLESAVVLRADGAEAEEPAAALGLAYRESRFKHDTDAPVVAAGAPGEARRDDDAGGGASPPHVPELILSATFRLQAAAPDEIKARLDEIRRWRQAHQPLGFPSAGSVFRNPPGDSAGRLIDACGLKGRRVGGAVVSEKHANFIVNDRHGTAADVRQLAELARDEVLRRFGVELVFEVQFLGDWSGWERQVTAAAGVEADSQRQEADS